VSAIWGARATYGRYLLRARRLLRD
jgi:hypothetical protein